MATQKFKVNEVDIDLINEAAKVVGLTVAAFIRRAAIAEARRVIGERNAKADRKG